jgi:hypothetical protein
MEVIILAELLAIREGAYTIYVFKNLESNEFIMCTRLPSWQVPEIQIGDSGYLKYQKAKAGEEYFNPVTGEKQIYRYSNLYFLNFIQKTDINNSNITF